MPKAYRKRPVVIEAEQFDGSRESAEKIFDWAAKHESAGMLDLGVLTNTPIQLTIETLEGEMLVRPGDYVIRGVDGEFYPCKADIFRKTYVAV